MVLYNSTVRLLSTTLILYLDVKAPSILASYLGDILCPSRIAIVENKRDRKTSKENGYHSCYSVVLHHTGVDMYVCSRI